MINSIIIERGVYLWLLDTPPCCLLRTHSEHCNDRHQHRSLRVQASVSRRRCLTRCGECGLGVDACVGTPPTLPAREGRHRPRTLVRHSPPQRRSGSPFDFENELELNIWFQINVNYFESYKDQFPEYFKCSLIIFNRLIDRTLSTFYIIKMYIWNLYYCLFQKK